MILVSLIATVGLLTFCSWFYNRFYVIDANCPSAKIGRKSIFHYFSLHMIYALNIMTNQGKSFIYIYSFNSFTLLWDNLIFRYNLKVAEKGLTASHFELWLDFGFWLAWSWSIATRELSSLPLQYRKWSQPSNLSKTWLKVKMLELSFVRILLLGSKFWYKFDYISFRPGRERLTVQAPPPFYKCILYFA